MWSLSKEVCEIEDEPFKEKVGAEEMGSLQVEVEHLQVEVEHLVGKGESSEKAREGEGEAAGAEGEGEVGSPGELLAEEDFHEETGQLCYLMILC